MLQILLVSFIPRYVFGLMNKDVASFFGMSISSLLFVFVAIAFIINYACYFSEIFRGGIESIPKGQYEDLYEDDTTSTNKLLTLFANATIGVEGGSAGEGVVVKAAK